MTNKPHDWVPDATKIREFFRQQRQIKGMRQRDIAYALGISEGALLAAHQGDNQDDAKGQTAPCLRSMRLRNDWAALFAALAPFEMMALTRNEACVMESNGVYRDMDWQDAQTAVISGGGIVAQFNFSAWAQTFAIEEYLSDASQRSVQFFDIHGQAVHKAFFRLAGDAHAFADFTEHFAMPITPVPAQTTTAAAGQIKILAPAIAEPAQRSAPQQIMQALPIESVQRLLDAAAATSVPVDICVCNHGVRQQQTITPRRVAVVGPWINILNPGFNLHLREDLIDHIHITRTAVGGGWATTLRCYDGYATEIVSFAGAQASGMPDRPDWHSTLVSLLKEVRPCTT